MSKKKKIIVTLIICAAIIIAAALVGSWLIKYLKGKPVVVDDAGKYFTCLSKESAERYAVNLVGGNGIFPDVEENGGTIEEFFFARTKFYETHIVTYATIKYNDDSYEQEMGRLSEIGVDEYTGIYSVTGAPEGYCLQAMISDEYNGFIYAITPEKPQDTITYVCIYCSNYSLDSQLDEYLPKQYLLDGYDASSDNPYKKMH